MTESISRCAPDEPNGDRPPTNETTARSSVAGTGPAPGPLPRNVFVIPALHGDLLGTPQVKRMVRRFLADGTVRVPGKYNGTAELVAAAAAAWRMPEITPPQPACGR